MNDSAGGDSLRCSALRLAIAAALLTIVQHVVGPARLAASFSGITDGSLQDFYFRSDAGIAHSVRMVGLLTMLAGLILRKQTIAVAGAVGACLSFVMMGHTVTHAPRWALAALLAIHVAIVAFWFGSLRPLRRLPADSPADYAALLDRFSRIASRMVPILFFAGLGLTVILLGSFAKLATPYGFMIIAKIAGFALLLGLASLNRWRLAPKIHSGDDQAIASFRNIAAVEWCIIAAVIIITESATPLFSP